MTSAGPLEVLAHLSVWKGHGTENDFVLIDDRDDTLDMSDALVRALCDRRAGIGGDGVLRVLRTASGQCFMDYRNADGSIAEMCGNGARVFAHYLRCAGLVDRDVFSIGTRAGDVDVRLEADDQVTVVLGPAAKPGSAHLVSCAGLSAPLRGQAVTMPNPHVVVFLESPGQLQALDLSAAPAVTPALPGGQNVEFVVVTGPRSMLLRVHERGSGETRSCGTGVAAAVVAAQSRTGAVASLPSLDDGLEVGWRITVPGGSLRGQWDGGERVEVTGPAVLVGRVVLGKDWLATIAGDTVTPSAVS